MAAEERRCVRLETEHLSVTPNTVMAKLDRCIIRNYRDAFGTALSVDETWERYCGELKAEYGPDYELPAVTHREYDDDDDMRAHAALLLNLKAEAEDVRLQQEVDAKVAAAVDAFAGFTATTKPGVHRQLAFELPAGQLFYAMSRVKPLFVATLGTEQWSAPSVVPTIHQGNCTGCIIVKSTRLDASTRV